MVNLVYANHVYFLTIHGVTTMYGTLHEAIECLKYYKRGE